MKVDYARQMYFLINVPNLACVNVPLMLVNTKACNRL